MAKLLCDSWTTPLKIGYQKFPFISPISTLTASPMPSPCPTPAERRSPSPMPQQQQKQQPPTKVERPRKEAVSPAATVVFRPSHMQTAEASKGQKRFNSEMPSGSRQNAQRIGTSVMPSPLALPRKGEKTRVTTKVVTVQPMPSDKQHKKEVPQKS